MKKEYEDEEPEQDEVLLLMIKKFSNKYVAVEKVEDSALTVTQLYQAFNSFAGTSLSDGEMCRLIANTTNFTFEWDPLRGEFVWLIREE